MSGAATTQPCAYHAQTAATASCTSCRKPICPVCTSMINSRPLCAGCAVGRAPQHPWLAALFSLLVPGMGQLYNGEWQKAILFFVTAPILIPWAWSVIDAAGIASEIAAGRRDLQTVPTGALLLALKIAWMAMAVVYLLLAGFVFSVLARWIASVS